MRKILKSLILGVLILGFSEIVFAGVPTKIVLREYTEPVTPAVGEIAVWVSADSVWVKNASGNSYRLNATYRDGLVLAPANSGTSSALQAPFCEYISVGEGSININGKVLSSSSRTFVDWTDLASGVTKSPGTEYYVYACNDSGSLVYKLHTSPNLTTVDGMDAREIGYFHNSPPADINGTLHSDGEVLKYSIFSDEENKYVNMVDVGICKVDIYESTLYRPSTGEYFGEGSFTDYQEGDIAKSEYNKNPAVYTSWYEYKRAFARSGKFMLNPYQWYIAGIGTPDPDTSAPNERLDVTNITGDFQVGETISGATTNATATIASTSATALYITSRGATQFQNGETITGLTSLATAVVNNSDGAVGLEPCHIWNTGSWPDYEHRKPEHSSFSTYPSGDNSIKTGTAPKAYSRYGVWDAIGNVWEWVDLLIKDGRYNNDIALPSQNYITDFNIELGLPITTGSASSKYRNDYFWINTSGLRAALRSGRWTHGAYAGLFIVYLYDVPSDSDYSSFSSRGGRM